MLTKLLIKLQYLRLFRQIKINKLKGFKALVVPCRSAYPTNIVKLRSLGYKITYCSIDSQYEINLKESSNETA